ncbi:hypothetical protein PoB_003071000 [Plakobranchus ocellatus]|uniref:Uncharacterized protein n=1 Tax=Plakobranchus ocellatus TaxID=259542 RepID=A0AAV4A9Z4_9GAST|nr:hypothetical protein PoB_003071000 [Plakobranchus ocellatus]
MAGPKPLANRSGQLCGLGPSTLARLDAGAREELSPFPMLANRGTRLSPGLSLAKGGNVGRTLSEIGPAKDNRHIFKGDLLRPFASVVSAHQVQDLCHTHARSQIEPSKERGKAKLHCIHMWM